MADQVCAHPAGEDHRVWWGQQGGGWEITEFGMGFSPAELLPQLFGVHVSGVGAIGQVFDAIGGPLSIRTRPSPQCSMLPISRLSTFVFPCWGMSQCPWSAVPTRAVSGGRGLSPHQGLVGYRS